jgi:glycosyltransferase involved in cell wall biosynthesis
MKVLQLTDQEVETVYSRILNGEDIDRHNLLYAYDALVESGMSVVVVSNYKRNIFTRIINGIGFRLGFTHLVLQLKCLTKLRGVDVIYCHILQLTPFLSLLKRIGLLRIPVVAVAHDAFSEKSTSIQTWRYLDKVVCFGEKTLEIAMSKAEVPLRHRVCVDWGVDVPFYDRWVSAHGKEPKLDCVVASGCANRDYALLVDAFRTIDNCDLRIFAVNYDLPEGVPTNVHLRKDIARHNVGTLRHHYHDAFAIAIPIAKELDWCNGTTVLFEAMTMSKPVIMTRSKSNLIDIEKEGVGILVDYEDRQGWTDAIRYLKNNPQIAQQMGARGRALVDGKFNYKNFCGQIVDHIKMMKEERSAT